MPNYGPHERLLFDRGAAELYEEIVVAGSIRADDSRVRAGSDGHEAFVLLVDIGLLVHGASEAEFVPVDPAAVQTRVVGPLSQRGAELLTESSEWAKTFAQLGQAWRRSAHTERGPFTQVRGRPSTRSSPPSWATRSSR